MTSDAKRFLQEEVNSSSEVSTRISQSLAIAAISGCVKIRELLAHLRFKTHCRRSIGYRFLKLAASVLALLIASYGYAQNAFVSPVVQPSLQENATDLTSLNNAIVGALESSLRNAPFSDFEFELDSVGKTKFTISDSGSLELSLKTGVSLDYEETPTFIFRIVATKLSTSTSTLNNSSLRIDLALADVPERPEVLAEYQGDDGKVFYVQKTPDVGFIPNIFAAQVFNDPDRNSGAMRFKPCADDFQIEEYRTPGSTSIDNTRGNVLQDANEAGTGNGKHCLTLDQNGDPDPQDVTRGGQVVNVTTIGSAIRITPLASTTPGVRRAVLTFRAWSSTPVLSSGSIDPAANLTLSDAAKITVYVKTGRNNPPTFGAIGYQVRVNESLDDTTESPIGPPTAGTWNATDLDENDTISYRLEGSPATQACRTMADTTVISNELAVAVGRGCAWLDSTELAKTPPNVSIKGRNLDYESAPLPDRRYTITLVASDGYDTASDARVPIHLLMQNVDEGLEFNGPIDEIKQLVLGRTGRSVDLNDYFSDPDGLAINYSAFSSVPNVVSVTVTGSNLTVTPGSTAGSAFITITATTVGSIGSVDSNVQSIQVIVRETNRPPEFEQSILTVQVPNPVAESQPTDHLIRLSSLRYNDPDGDTITATILNSSLFEAVVNPVVGDQTYNGEVGIRLIGALDFETNAQHRLQIQLSDGWDTSTRTVEVIVDVGNVNEAPVVATDPTGATRTIPPQTVAVNGTGSIDVSTYFTDPDRGDRLLITAVSSNPSFATAQVTGTSTVQFTGLLETGVTPVTVTVTARDLGGLSAQLQFQLNVSANRPPRLIQAPLAQTLTLHQGAAEVSLIGTFVDDDPGDRILRYEAVSNDDAIVIAQVSSDGNSVVLIPRAEGVTSVTITAYDTRSGSSTTSFVVTVLGNTPPVLTQRIPSVELRPNGTTTIEVTNYFSDPDGDTLSFRTSVDRPDIATTTLFNNRTLTIQARAKGTAEVTVTAFDPDGESVSTTFLVAVTNEDPIGSGQISTSLNYRGETDTIDVSPNFVDPDQDAMTFTVSVANDAVVEASIANTMLTLNAIGIGTTQVTVTATDPYGASGSLSFNVTISNQGPTVVTTIEDQVTHREGELSVPLGPHFADEDNDELTFTVEVVDTRIASASVQAAELMLNGIALGSTVVRVTADDGFGGRITSFFTLTVQNREPEVTMMIADQLTHRAGLLTIPLDPIFADADGDELTYSARIANRSIATVSVQRSDLEIEGLALGSTEVTVTAEDAFGGEVVTSFNLTIQNRDPETTMMIADQTMIRAAPVAFDLSTFFSDPDGDALVFRVDVEDATIVRATIEGMNLNIVGVGVGMSMVTVEAIDSPDGVPASTTFSVTVENQAPTVTVEIADESLVRQESASIDLTMNFTDPDGDPLQFEATIADSSVATTAIQGSVLTVTGQSVDSTLITVTASDEYGGRVSDIFRITVNNQAPVVAMEIPDQEITRRDLIVVDLSMIFSDPDGDALEFLANTANAAVATTSIQGSTLTVSPHSVNATSVTVTANDEFGGTVSESFQVTVANQAPHVANAPDDVTLNRTQMPTLDMSMVFADDDGDTLTLSATSSAPSVADVSVSGFNITIRPLTLGTADITLEVVDPYNATVLTSFQVTVENLAPVVNATLSNVRMTRVESQVVDASNVFVDNDADAVTISAESSDTSIATVSVSGTSLTLDGVNLGTTTVTVTGTDANGAMVSTSFDVTVENVDPMVATQIADFNLQVGGDAETRDVSSAFSDDGSEALILSVNVGVAEIATATVSDMSLSVTPVSRGTTTITVTATDAQGATVEQAVTVNVTEEEIRKVANTALASFSRAVLNSVSSTIGARLMADADGLYTPFTTYSFDDFAPSENFTQPIDGFSNVSPFAHIQMPWAHTPSPTEQGYAPSGMNDLASLVGRGFALKLAAAGDPTFWSIWGAADRQSFEGADHDGSASSFYFGGDMTMRGQYTFGLAVGRNAGDADYTYGTATQTLDITLTGVYPYVRFQPSDRTTIYGTLGVGSGELETSVVGGFIDVADLKSNIGLIGGRQVVFTMMNGLNLAIVGDYGWANLETDDVPGGAGNLSAETSRIRGGLETSFNMAMGQDGSFVPFVTVGFRSDSGDDDVADSGVEISGGLRITNPIFSLDANFRTLATYGTDDYSESGFSVMAVLNPSAGATGLNISVAPSWGASTTSTNALWADDYDSDRLQQMAAFGHLNRETLKWDSHVGYGFLVLSDRFILTPFLDIRSGYSTDQDFSIGAKLFQSLRSKQDLNVDVQIGQDSTMTGTQEESVRVNARLNF